MKTNEELKALKEEVEALNKKLAELTKDELVQVTGVIQPDTTKSWFGGNLSDAEEYPGQVKVRVYHENKSQLSSDVVRGIHHGERIDF